MLVTPDRSSIVRRSRKSANEQIYSGRVGRQSIIHGTRCNITSHRAHVLLLLAVTRRWRRRSMSWQGTKRTKRESKNKNAQLRKRKPPVFFLQILADRSTNFNINNQIEKKPPNLHTYHQGPTLPADTSMLLNIVLRSCEFSPTVDT